MARAGLSPPGPPGTDRYDAWVARVLRTASPAQKAAIFAAEGTYHQKVAEAGEDEGFREEHRAHAKDLVVVALDGKKSTLIVDRPHSAEKGARVLVPHCAAELEPCGCTEAAPCGGFREATVRAVYEPDEDELRRRYERCRLVPDGEGAFFKVT